MKEITGRRTLRSKLFHHGKRKFTLRTGIKKPLHYTDADGHLQDIDLTPHLDRGHFLVDKAPYTARIGRDRPGYRYTGAAGAVSAELVEIVSKPIGAREPEIADRRFYWRGVSLDTDCTIIPRNARLDALVTLHSENAPRRLAWEILGDRNMVRPVVGRDASGKPLELIQFWNGDRLEIEWTGNVLDRRKLRQGDKSPTTPKYPVWIDPTVNEAIVAGADDVDSFTGFGSGFTTDGTDLFWGVDSYGFIGYVGLRFQTIAIPQGSTIDSATLTLDVLTITGSPSSRIYADDVDDAGVWSDPGNRPKNITKTTAFAGFSPTATGTSGIGVTSIVQEIINRTGWVSSNDMAFAGFDQVGSATNSAYIAAYEHTTRTEAQLDITYTEAGGDAVRAVGRGLTQSVLLHPRRLVR